MHVRKPKTISEFEEFYRKHLEGVISAKGGITDY